MPAARTPTRHAALQSLAGVGVVLVALATVLAYWPALRAPLLFDDVVAIDTNPTITTLWPPSIALHPPSDSPVAGRPVANLSFAINHALNRALGIDQRRDPDGPDKTISYHVVNLLLHLACGMLLIGIVRRTLASGRFGPAWAADASGISLAVGALWLLHPLQTEAVNYLTQRTELLASACYLATLYCSVRAWDATSSRMRWYVGGVVACLLGAGSKEIVASAPIIVVLYDRAFRVDAWRDLAADALRGRRRFYAALFATWIVLAVLIATSSRGSPAPASAVPWYAYLVSQGCAIPHYLRLLLWPRGFTIDYGYTAIPFSRSAAGLAALALLGVATVVAWTRGNRWGWAAFCGTWFFAILAPSSSIIPVPAEIAAERRAYLAVAAVIVAVVVGVAALARGRAPRRAAPTLALITIAGLAALTFQRSERFDNPEVIWGDAVGNQPANARAWNNLGSILADQPLPRVGEAESFFRHALDIDPTYAPAMYNLASSAIAAGRTAEAESLLRRDVSSTPDDEPALVKLGAVVMLRGAVADALPYLEHAVRIAPFDPTALTTLGLAYAAIGRVGEAAALYRRALQADPANDAALEALSRLPAGGS